MSDKNESSNHVYGKNKKQRNTESLFTYLAKNTGCFYQRLTRIFFQNFNGNEDIITIFSIDSVLFFNFTTSLDVQSNSLSDTWYCVSYITKCETSSGSLLLRYELWSF